MAHPVCRRWTIGAALTALRNRVGRIREVSARALLTVVLALPVLALAATAAHADPQVAKPVRVATVTDGYVIAWGYNLNGEVGNGGFASPQSTPHEIFVGPATVTQVAVGNDTQGDFTLARLSDGTVDSWGSNRSGQLANGSTSSNAVARPVNGLTGVAQVAAGNAFGMALLTDGEVLAWGSNATGELGDNTGASRVTPAPVPGLTGVTQIAAGDGMALAVLADGTVRAWGRNDRGQLGDGTSISKSLPITVPNLTKVKQVAVRGASVLALRTDGTVRSWGSNDNGVLGLGSSGGSAFVPQVVPGLTGVAQVSVSQHALAVRTDGTVVAWGLGSSGQLGLGTLDSRVSPTVIPGLTGVKQISAGGKYSLALLTDGHVRAWGDNTDGVLGDGSSQIQPQKSPVPVPFFNTAAQVEAGALHSTVVDRPNFHLALNPTSGSMNDTGSTSTQLRMQSFNGFTGTATLRVVLPAGVMVSLSNSTIREGELVTLTFSVQLNGLPGTQFYQVTVEATSAGDPTVARADYRLEVFGTGPIF
jgi:alpha-tubulin suppressor-like RCC1 family protein